MEDKLEKQLQHIIKYKDIYSYLVVKPRNIDEFKRYLSEEQNKAYSTIKAFISVLRKGDAGVIAIKNDEVMVDQTLVRLMIDQIENFFRLEHSDADLENLFNEFNQVNNALVKVQKEYEELLEKYQALEMEHAALRAKYQRNAVSIENRLNSPVLIKDSVEIWNARGQEENEFDYEPAVKLDIPEILSRPSYYDEIIEKRKKFTEDNYHKRTFGRLLKDSVLQERMKDIQILSKLGLVKKKEEKAEVEEDAPLSEFEIRLREARAKDLHAVQEILDNKILTDQEKLGLYAIYSDYRNTDMSELINMAGKYCVNANTFIMFMEAPRIMNSDKRNKDMMTVLLKSSEYLMKKKFAKELLQGDWYIKANYCGKDAKFQLVPVDEINELRRAAGLGKVTTKAKMTELDEPEKKLEIQDEIQSEVELSHFNGEEDLESEMPEFPVEEE